jgi:hypothetical protein
MDFIPQTQWSQQFMNLEYHTIIIKSFILIATIPGARMREELFSLVSQRLRVLVSTDPKDACPFQFCFLLHPSIVSPAIPNISCYCVVMFVCVPVFPCVFLESFVVCFVNFCVSSSVFRCLGPMPLL